MLSSDCSTSSGMTFGFEPPFSRPSSARFKRFSAKTGSACSPTEKPPAGLVVFARASAAAFSRAPSALRFRPSASAAALVGYVVSVTGTCEDTRGNADYVVRLCVSLAMLGTNIATRWIIVSGNNSLVSSGRRGGGELCGCAGGEEEERGGEVVCGGEGRGVVERGGETDVWRDCPRGNAGTCLCRSRPYAREHRNSLEHRLFADTLSTQVLQATLSTVPATLNKHVYPWVPYLLLRSCFGNRGSVARRGSLFQSPLCCSGVFGGSVARRGSHFQAPLCCSGL